MTNKLSENQYYSLMAEFTHDMPFEEVYGKWYACFTYMLKSFKVGYRDTVISHLFHNFDMLNWHFKTDFYEASKETLLKEFCSEAHYISDRYSYDRIMRAHFFFIRAFENDLDKIRYPSLYNEE